MENVPLKTSKENGCYILDICCEKIEHNIISVVQDFIKKHKRGKCALNLENAHGINNEFLELLKISNISIFGASTEVLGYMSLTNTINLVPVYRSKSDFLKDKRRFIKRNFRIVKGLCQPLLHFLSFLSALVSLC